MLEDYVVFIYLGYMIKYNQHYYMTKSVTPRSFEGYFHYLKDLMKKILEKRNISYHGSVRGIY